MVVVKLINSCYNYLYNQLIGSDKLSSNTRLFKNISYAYGPFFNLQVGYYGKIIDRVGPKFDISHYVLSPKSCIKKVQYPLLSFHYKSLTILNGRPYHTNLFSFW